MPGPNDYGHPYFPGRETAAGRDYMAEALRTAAEKPSVMEEILTELREIRKFLQHTVIQQKLAEVQAEYAALKAKHEGKE